MASAQLNGAVERRDRVLGEVRRVAAVGDHGTRGGVDQYPCVNPAAASFVHPSIGVLQARQEQAADLRNTHERGNLVVEQVRRRH